MRKASIGDAKAHFSEFVKRVEAGDEVLVTRRGTPVARIVSIKFGKERFFANDEGLGFVDDDFNEPLPPATLKQFFARSKSTT